MLVIDDLTVRIAGRALLKTPAPAITPGARVGLVGRNGSGKTTLFNVIAGDISPEHGSVELPPRWRIGRLAQEAPNGPESLLEVVLAGRSRTQRACWPRRRPRTTRTASPRSRPGSPTSARMRRRRAPPRFCPASAFPTPTSSAALFGILRRLAHARGARRHAVRRARPADARRADQLSRPRRHALAAGSPGALSAHPDHHQPRPRPPGQRGRPDPVAGSAASSRSTAAAIPTSSACAASAWCSTRR